MHPVTWGTAVVDASEANGRARLMSEGIVLVLRKSWYVTFAGT